MTHQKIATRGAPFSEIVGEAFANLRVQGRRSALALLGILIGTASIIAMLNIGHIAQLETLKLFSNLGVDMLQIQATPTGQDAHGFDLATVEQLPSRDPDVLLATPLAAGRSPVVAGSQQADLSIVGMPASFAAQIRFTARQGRLLRTIDDCGQTAIIGKTAAEKLSAPGAELLPGATIAIGSYAFTVVGILETTPNEVFNPSDYNDAIIIPLACSRRVLTTSKPTVILVKLQPKADPDATGARLTTLLANPQSNVQIVSAHSYIKTMNEQKAVHSRMLAAVGGISLLVGGIGVMNVMLMGVMERRREIGLRAAIGATPRDLKTMFMVESATLAIIGGISGALLGLVAAYFVSRNSGWTFAVDWYVLPLGPGVAGLVGLIFGLYPAIMASRLKPIEALRAD